MKIKVQVDISPDTHEPNGLAQNLLEQVAIAIASGGTDGTHTRRSADGKTLMGEAKYTVTPDPEAK